MTKFDLFPHQQETLEFILDKPASADLSSPGTGKTLPGLLMAKNHLINGGSRIVVVSPKILMRSAWGNDADTFTSNLSVSYAEAPSVNREAAFLSGSDIVTMNYEGAMWLAAQSKRFLHNVLGAKPCIIVDESTNIKNPQAQRTKALLKLASLFTRRHIMTGTLCPNSATEAWAQYKLLDDGVRLGKRFTAFRNVMQRPINMGRFTVWQDIPDAQDVLYGLVSDISIRHEFDVVMKHVPSMTHRVIYYDLPRKQMELYKELERNSFLEHEGKIITAINAAAAANKLLQCASGAVYTDSRATKDKEWSIVDTGRYELIGELCEARQHSIVFFSWRHQKYELEKVLKAKKLTYAVLDGEESDPKIREQIVDDYQSGKYRVMLLAPRTASYGLTLSRATSVIYASPIYEAATKQQSDARIRRGMQDKVTESIIILANGTRDLDAYKVFTGKLDRLTALNNLFAGEFNV